MEWITAVVRDVEQNNNEESSAFLAETFQIAVEGFCKMFLTDACVNARVLSDLITLLFDPEISGQVSVSALGVNDAAIVQCLNSFFPRFAFTSREHQQLVAEAFSATVRRFCYAPKSSSLQQAAIDKLVPYFAELTSEAKLIQSAKQQRPSITKEAMFASPYSHNALALRFVEEMCSNPHGKETKLIAKALSELSLSKSDARSLKVLRAMVTDLAENLPQDKTLAKQVKSFSESLASLDPEPQNSLHDEEREVIRERISALSEEKDHFKTGMETYGREEDIRSEKGAQRKRALERALRSDDDDEASDEESEPEPILSDDDEPDNSSSDSASEPEKADPQPLRATSRPKRGAGQKAQAKMKENRQQSKNMSKIIKKQLEESSDDETDRENVSPSKATPKKRKRASSHATAAEVSDNEVPAPAKESSDEEEVAIVSAKRKSPLPSRAAPKAAPKVAAKPTARKPAPAKATAVKPTAAKATAAAKRVATRRATSKLRDVVESESGSNSESEEKPVKRTAAKRARAKKVALSSSDSDSSSSDHRPAKTVAAKRAAVVQEDSGSDSDSDSAEVKKPKVAAAKRSAKRAAAKKSAPLSRSDSGSNSDSESEDAAPPEAMSPRARVPAKLASAKPATKAESSSGSDSESSVPPPARQAPPPRAAPKKSAPMAGPKLTASDDDIDSDSSDKSGHMPRTVVLKSPSIARRLSTGSAGVRSPLTQSRTLADTRGDDVSDESDVSGHEPSPVRRVVIPTLASSDDESGETQVIGSKPSLFSAPKRPPSSPLSFPPRKPLPISVGNKPVPRPVTHPVSRPVPVAAIPRAAPAAPRPSTLFKPTASSSASAAAAKRPVAAPAPKPAVSRPSLVSASAAAVPKPRLLAGPPKPVAPRPVVPAALKAKLPPKTPNTKRREDIMNSAISLLECVNDIPFSARNILLTAFSLQGRVMTFIDSCIL